MMMWCAYRCLNLNNVRTAHEKSSTKLAAKGYGINVIRVERMQKKEEDRKGIKSDSD